MTTVRDIQKLLSWLNSMGNRTENCSPPFHPGNLPLCELHSVFRGYPKPRARREWGMIRDRYRKKQKQHTLWIQKGQHAMEEKQINMIFISRLSYWVLLAFLVIPKDWHPEHISGDCAQYFWHRIYIYISLRLCFIIKLDFCLLCSPGSSSILVSLVSAGLQASIPTSR